MKASRTYEVAPAGEGAAGLEEYLVETKDGEVAGKVVALVDRDGERFLLFDSGTPPIAKERRAAGGMTSPTSTTTPSRSRSGRISRRPSTSNPRMRSRVKRRMPSG